MADTKRTGKVNSDAIINSFSKIMPEFSTAVYEEACKAFGAKGKAAKITERDFLLVFDPTEAE